MELCKVMKRNTLERREKIKDMILSKGLWSLNKKQLARDFKVSYPTIYSDIRAILKKIPDEKIEEIGYELNQSFKEALSIARKLLRSKDDMMALKAVDVITKVIDKYTSFLEAFGKKPEIMDVDHKPFDIKVNIVKDRGFDLEGFKETILKKAKDENKSTWAVLREVLDIPIKMDIQAVKEWLNRDDEDSNGKVTTSSVYTE